MTIERHDNSGRMSRAVIHGETVHLSGLTADDTGADVRGQTRQILEKIDHHLGLCGTDKSKLLTAQIWLADIATFDEMNAVWDAWVDRDNAPARATVEAKLATPQIRIEIMVTAAR